MKTEIMENKVLNGRKKVNAGVRLAMLAETKVLVMKRQIKSLLRKHVYNVYSLVLPGWLRMKKYKSDWKWKNKHSKRVSTFWAPWSKFLFEIWVCSFCIWMGRPILNLHHMLLVVYSGNSDLNYILHNLIAINKSWKKM